MLLVVAEKPSVARDLARVLGVRAVGRSCFEGARHVITWCVGHLVELDEPASYDGRWKAWRLDTLPMLPAEFRLRPSRHAIDQLRAVTGLLGERRFTGVINACDAGREGELIFRYVYQHARARLPVERLWISSLTDDAIRRGFAALRPGAQLAALGDAARSRSEADWLVGMNATRAITVRGRDGGHDALYSIGRVQTPTLAMLVERERAIERFVPRDYWEVTGEFRTAGGERFRASWRALPDEVRRGADPDAARFGDRTTTRLAAAELARALVERDAVHGAAADPIGPRVERLRARTVREPPPQLFDLTSLQRTANRRFGWAAARTLELAQALYERHKLVTYPRTDSRYLTSDVAGELARVFAALAEVPEYGEFAAELVARPPRPGRRIVDDAKVHDHHAIIPTGNQVRLDALDRDEQRLFDLIARRFLGAFFPDAEFAVTEAWIRVLALAGAPPPFPADVRRDPNAPPADEPPLIEALPPPPDRYLARGRMRTVAGWQAVAGIEPRSGGARAATEPDDDSAVLPVLVEGQPLDGQFAAAAKQTRPPPRYTEATLLSGMESAGKVIDDAALREAMRDCGLGTPATRAAIIETLLRRAYIVRDRQSLVPTVLGIGLIGALPVASLASPELTGRWEARLARISRGEDSRAAFMADIARYVAELVDAIRTAAPPPPPPAGAPPQAASPGKGGRSKWRKSNHQPGAAAYRKNRDRDGASSAFFDERSGGNAVSGTSGKRSRGDALSGASGKRSRGDAVSGTSGKRSRGDALSGASGASGKRSRGNAVSGTSGKRSRGASSRASGNRGNAWSGASGQGSRKNAESESGTRFRGDGDGFRETASSGMSGERSRGDGASGTRFRRDGERFRDGDDLASQDGISERRGFRPMVSSADLAIRSQIDALARQTAGLFRSADEPSAGIRNASEAEPKRARTVEAHAEVPRPAEAPDKRIEPARARPRPAAARSEAPSIEPAPARTRPSRARPADAETAELGCPRCRAGVLLTGARGWGCSRWREGCRFVVWFELAGHRVTPAQLRDLVTRGRTRKLRGGYLALEIAGDHGAARWVSSPGDT